jgi:antitoxin component YwqK of YwqJK toxin-antitoxin module
MNMKNGILEGKSIDWYKNGHLKSEILFKDNNIDHNNKTDYYENGNKESERFTTGGFRDYKETLWYEDGDVLTKAKYKDGICLSGDCPK